MQCYSYVNLTELKCKLKIFIGLHKATVVDKKIRANFKLLHLKYTTACDIAYSTFSKRNSLKNIYSV